MSQTTNKTASEFKAESRKMEAATEFYAAVVTVLGALLTAASLAGWMLMTFAK